ncbi:hypothetical protein HJD18_15580 [Thermoleophilia bacterium SCSIO 60948]|nr:hypothetical protein HJD18_15580 [Thermoleophilia bacterium SCSIO 60948]
MLADGWIRELNEDPADGRASDQRIARVDLVNASDEHLMELVVFEDMLDHFAGNGDGFDAELADVQVSVVAYARKDGGEPGDSWTGLQQRQALELLQEQAWTEVDGDLRVVETALRRALDATTHDLDRWEKSEVLPGWKDEFSLSPEEVARLDPYRRLEYVARLLATIETMYGLKDWPSRKDGGRISDILRGLNDISLGIRP